MQRTALVILAIALALLTAPVPAQCVPQLEVFLDAAPAAEPGRDGPPNIFIRFDDGSSRIDPPPSTLFIAYICLENLEPGPGVEGVAKVVVGERRLIWIWTHEAVEWLRLKLWAWLP